MDFPNNNFNNNPNIYSTNFPLENTQEQQKNQTQNTNTSSGMNVVQEMNNINKDKVFNFLNTKTTTILTFASAVAIGLSLKDFVGALVLNIFQPCLMLLIITLDRNNYLPITETIREKNPQIDIAKFLGATLILKLVLFCMYLIFKYSSILF